MAAHGDGRLPPVAVHVDDPRLGKLAQQAGAEHQRPARTFDPDVPPEPPAQPGEEMPAVIGGRLPGLPANDRLEFVEQRLVAVGDVRQRGAQDGRHVALREAGARVVERIKQLFVPLPQHEAGAVLLAAAERPHPVPAQAPATERPHADEAEELREAEHARVPVQDVRHHRRAAPSGAEDQDGRDRPGRPAHQGLAFSARNRSGRR